MAEPVLVHYGVPGMQWGKTKTKESRSDYKARVQKEELDFNQKKLDDIFQKAVKSGDKVLIQTRYAGDTVRTITTGKEFVAELSRGRAFDVKVTEIFATQTKEGPYQMTGERNQYVKSARGSQ